MKNLITIFSLFVLSFAMKAQEKESITPKDYTITMDSLLKNIKKDKMKTGLLYDRVVANANLLEFNNKESKQVSSYWHYIQSLSEVHRSSLDPKNKMQYEVVEDLRHKNGNVLSISYINTSIDYIDYGTKEQPNLIFKEGYFYNVDDRNPFKQKQVTVVAALAENIYNQEVKIVLNQDMLYQDDSNPIKNLTAIINGTEIKLVSNFENLKEAKGYRFKGEEKEIIFNIEFKNETSLQTRATINISLPQVSTPSTTSFPLIEDFLDNLGIDRNSIENTIPFQGYNETTPIYGVLDYRTYYNRVTNNGSAKSKINKPVIILDGFDPGDKRKIYQESTGYLQASKSLYELMTYDHDNNIATDPINFVDKLTSPAYGFDVTLVNFPENKIIDASNPTSQVWVNTGGFIPAGGLNIPIGHWTTVTNYTKIADGGADYIERNAMALVALLKRENKKLVDNGSTEQITLIGPSMGGLISRYALAYMEKNNIPHNVKLWVSFDSPHLGANVPIAAQENIYFFGHSGQKEKAKHKFHENFASPATRQMLIEQMDYKHLNYSKNDNPSLWTGQTLTGHSNPNFLGQNNTAPFRTRFLNELENLNGLPNSKGFPINVRKIALINGTTNGTKTNTEGELFLELAGFKPSWNKAVAFEDRNLATPGNWSQTFSGKVTIPSSSSSIITGGLIGGFLGGIGGAVIGAGVAAIPTVNYATANRPNLNPRGSMDVVQGAYTDAPRVIKNEFQPDLDDAGVDSQWRAFKPFHCFIPTISSLAFKNPNFDWSAPLNRNLICDTANKEIPFDSYFSPSKNEEHVFITNESANWLLAEIQGNPQLPRFDVIDSELAGPYTICNDQTVTYNFSNDLCKIPSLVQSWSVSTNTLEIIGFTSLGITVKGLPNTSGFGIISATFSNGMIFTKKVWVGKPSFYIKYNYDFNYPVNSTVEIISNLPNISISQQGITSTTFTGSNFSGGTINMQMLDMFKAKQNGSCNIPFTVTATNACGTTTKVFNGTNRLANSNLKLYKVFPNPANDIVKIDLVDTENKPEENTTITGELFDMMGQPKTKVQIINNQATFSIQGLKQGIYVLKIYINNEVETHQIAVE